MKQSKYTLQIPTDVGMLLFHIANTGFVYLTESEKSIYCSFIKNVQEPFPEDEALVMLLSDMGYLVKEGG